MTAIELLLFAIIILELEFIRQFITKIAATLNDLATMIGDIMDAEDE